MDVEEYRRKYEAGNMDIDFKKEIQRIYNKYWALLDVYRSNQAALLIIELFLKDLKELLK